MGKAKKAVTIYDIAQAVGVDSSTVSRVLNGMGNVSAETRQAILDAANDLHYQPNIFARSLKTKRTMQIILSIPDISNPFYTGMIDQIYSYFHKLGYSVLIHFSHAEADEEVRVIRNLKKNYADALIMVSLDITDALVAEIEEVHRPVVLSGICNNYRPLSESSYHYVGVNTHKGLYDATDYLIKNGHTQIGYIGLSDSTQPGKERLSGYRNALQDNGIGFNAGKVVLGGLSEEYGYQATLDLLAANQDVTAICTTSDIIALGVYGALHHLGLQVGQDISIVSMDNTQLSALLNPRLTSTNIFPDLIGKKAAEIVFSILEGRQIAREEVAYTPELVIRDSVRRLAEPGRQQVDNQ